MSREREPETLGELLHRVSGLPPEAAVAALARALQQLSPDAAPGVGERLLAELASVAQEPSPTRPENLEAAISALERARSLPSFDRFRPKVFLLMSLAELLMLRVRGGYTENLKRAVAAAEESARSVSKIADPAIWAMARLSVGRARFALSREAVDENRAALTELALSALTQAGLTLAPLDSGLWATSQLELAKVYRVRSVGGRVENFERALECCERASGVVSKEQNRELWAEAQLQRGLVFFDRPDEDRRPNVEQAREAFEAAVGGLTAGSAGWAAALTNLGNTLAELQQFGRARECYEKALRVRTRRGSPVQWAETTDNLGNVISKDPALAPVARLHEAIRCWRSVLEVRNRDDHPLRHARSLEKIALGLMQLSELEQEAATRYRAEAAVTLSTALSILAPGGAPADAFRVAGVLARVCESADAWDIAASAHRFKLDYLDRLYDSSVLQRGREQELAVAEGIAPDAAYALARAGLLTDAVVALERFRARRFGDLLLRDRADLSELGRQHPELHARLVDALTRLREAEITEIGTESAAAGAFLDLFGLPRGDTTDPSGGGDLPGRLRLLQQDVSTTLRAVRATPGFEGLLRAPDFESIAAAVTAERPLAYLLETTHGSLILLLLRADDEAGVEIVPIRADELTTAHLRRLLLRFDDQGPSGGYLVGRHGDLPELAASLDHIRPLLGRLLMSPLAEELADRGVERVVLVPCGLLGALPLHAAPVESGDPEGCLLDRVAVHYASSARALVAADHQARAHDGSPVSFLGIADPRRPGVVPLHFAEPEIEAVRALLPDGTESAVLAGDAATVGRLVGKLARASHLHLACHGRAGSSDPLDSSLVLADADLSVRDLLVASTARQGGPVLEGVRLVVASACDSGVTDVTRLADEAVGLPAGFVLAGAAGAVATLWPVNDLSSAILMIRFYELYLGRDADAAGVDPPTALAQAQCWLRDAAVGEVMTLVRRHPALLAAMVRLVPARPGGSRPYSSPRYWAPYIFFGA